MPSQDPISVPASPHMEVAILGCCLLEPAAIQDAIRLQPTDFSLDSHQRIFRAVLSLHAAGQGVDTNTVRAELDRKGELSSVGGIHYLLHVTDGIPRNMNVESYVRVVKEKSMLRQAMALHHDGYQMASDPSQDAESFITESIRQFEDLRAESSDKPMQTAGQYLASLGGEEAVVDALATTNGLKLGWAQFDDITGGLQRKEMMILAAHSGMGKSAGACNIIHNVAVIDGKVTAYFPLEDKNRHAIRRMLSASTELPYRMIRDGRFTENDRELFLRHYRRICDASLYIDDSNGLTMARIKSRCAQIKRQVGSLDLVLLDQLSHIEDADVFKKGSSGEERLGWQAKSAKNMAEDLDVPVILLHQLTQESAKRTNPRPVLSDLLGSGKIRNHADIVAFFYRAEYFDKDNQDIKGKGELIVAKNRQGETLDCAMLWDGSIQKWTDPKSADPNQQYFQAYQQYRD